jgi:hypothetical protein
LNSPFIFREKNSGCKLTYRSNMRRLKREYYCWWWWRRGRRFRGRRGRR